MKLRGGGGVVCDSVANFVLMKSEDVDSFVAFLEKRGIFIRNYSHIIPNHCRISIGTREQMKILKDKILEYIGQQR